MVFCVFLAGILAMVFFSFPETREHPLDEIGVIVDGEPAAPREASGNPRNRSEQTPLRVSRKHEPSALRLDSRRGRGMQRLCRPDFPANEG
ncbi:hypothetical protein BO94DRAFT_538528 [Aspergillus sclerotioniger CBS 115572]|uniref:Major facilitator superfamily (MFS) profile domain-containing protein n=1 Tax=Aspergillus sclerotioniger CBS 115572 TaxID=1450535 RepID=A0A317VQN5_9EURO|nr:hypothetical protein BO94DRAFT_538528 [Aspergillus sclerotioniger CBS 115572]PWY75202.1 hypothetical protein BO94DRAFT_538528 [Aspergillus sclerotioniger CBS 115572]